jgi:putative redox protein
LAALGECTAITVRWYATQKGWPLEKVAVNLTHHKEDVPGQSRPIDVFEKDVTIEGAALTDEQKQRLYDVAAKCPVQRTLEKGCTIRSR